MEQDGLAVRKYQKRSFVSSIDVKVQLIDY